MHGQYSIQDCALMGGPIAAEPFWTVVTVLIVLARSIVPKLVLSENIYKLETGLGRFSF